MMNNIEQQIDLIIKKRRPAVDRISNSSDNLEDLKGNLLDMMALGEKFIKTSPDEKIKNEWGEIKFSQTIDLLNKSKSNLENLKERFSRDTLRIGVAGQARQGKSQLLQSLCGLSSQEIPTSSDGFTTGARSLIYHHNDDETYAIVSFYSQTEFLRDIIQPYYNQLDISEDVPSTLEQFRNAIFDDIPSDGGEKVGLYNQLQAFHDSLSSYESLIGDKDKRISHDEIAQYVSQHNPDNSDEKYYKYNAVRLVRIYTRFPSHEKGVGRIALADLPGLDEIKAGEAERLIKTLAQDVDMLLFVKLPPDTGDAWKQQDMQLYKLAQQALKPIDLEKCSFMVLNRHSDGKRDQRCKEMQLETRKHGIYTSDTVIANCMNSDESQQTVLLPVLSYMAENIQTLDDNYLNAKYQELNHLGTEIEQVLKNVRGILKAAGIGRSEPATFGSIFTKKFEPMEGKLGKYVEDLSQAKNDPDDQLSEAFNKAFNSAENENSLPSEDKLEDDKIQEQGWGQTHEKHMHIMRNQLTSHFHYLDEALRQSITDMKEDIAKMFQESGLENLAPESSGDDFLQVLLDEINKDDFPELYQGLKDLIEFQLLFRGLFQHRLRESLSDLYPNETSYSLPSKDRSQLKPEFVRDLLLNSYEDALEKVQENLKPLLTEPGMARHAIVEEFRDRIWKASDAREQWRIFLDERKDRLWPELFKWQKLLAQTDEQLECLSH